MLFRFLKNLLFGPPKRDLSRLENEDVDLVEEEIDLSGGPLKPEHRRRALRDRRLLPKRKPSGFGSLKRKKYFSKSEVQRLFSRTLRTTNRKIRDLQVDEEQLDRLQLPLLKNEADLAELLSLSLPQLHHYSIYRFRETCSHYICFAVPKRKGGQRLILAPKRKLKGIQRTILREILDKLPELEFAHGFIKGRSVASGAKPHVDKSVILKLDLKDFFPTVTYPRVRGLFISLGYSYPVATTLAVLCTESVRQPVVVEGKTYHVPVGERHCVQGAPTSPAICNQIASRLDKRLAGLARKLNFDYTRYADDLTFSGQEKEKLKHLVALSKKIIEEEGFQIRRDKTRVLHQGGHQQVTGVTVNKVLGLSRKERRKLRAELHKLHTSDKPDPQAIAKAKGKLAYLEMLNPEQALALREKYPL